MTVKRKNSSTANKPLSKQESELADKFINSGGKTQEESQNKAALDMCTRFTVRMTPALVVKIDSHRKAKVGNISRNTWILEAISRRLKQDD